MNRNVLKLNERISTFPQSVNLLTENDLQISEIFLSEWKDVMSDCCDRHSVWEQPFSRVLRDFSTDAKTRFRLASVWLINMVVGSYCFPRYVAALAARAEQDAVRHGLLENAWDESGSYNHEARSHFWLAVRLARLLGLSDKEIERIQPLPDAKKYTDEHYRQCESGDFGFALGMLCLIEEFTTREFSMIFEAFLSSCEAAMGITPAEFVMKGAEYFTANISDDERHREEMPKVVAAWLHADGVDLRNSVQVRNGLRKIRDGARYSADLRQAFFQDIYRFVASGGDFRGLV